MDDRNADIKEIRARVDRFLAERRTEIWPIVRDTIADTLGIDASTVEPASNLVRDLTATSLDFLDLIYRLESTFDIKIPRGPIHYVVQNGLDERIESDGRLGPRALERLRLVMPEATGTIGPGLKAQQISEIYTAETFVRLVAMVMSEAPVPSVS